MMTNNRNTSTDRVKSRSKILAAALLLSLSGPLVAGLTAPSEAEAQVYPHRQVVSFFGLDVCAWFSCHGWYCCGPRADPPI